MKEIWMKILWPPFYATDTFLSEKKTSFFLPRVADVECQILNVFG